jgi:DNA repair ATPase RecN
MTDEMRADGHEPATKADMRGLSTRLDGHDGNLRRLNVAFAKMSCDMVEVKAGLKEVRNDISRFSTILERSSGNIEAALRKMDMQASMLMDHEGRITKLEPRSS